MMNETIDCGERHGGIGEDLSPFAERLVGGDEHRATFVSCADELEQHAGLGLVIGDIGEIVEDQEVEAIEPIDGGLEIELATRRKLAKPTMAPAALPSLRRMVFGSA